MTSVVGSAEDVEKQKRYEANRERFVAQCCYVMKLAPYGFEVCPICKGCGMNERRKCFMCDGEGKLRRTRR